MSLAARRPADPAAADGVRSPDRSTVRLRRLSRTVAPEVDRERRIVRETERVAARMMPPAAGTSAAAQTPERLAGTTEPARLAALTGGSLMNAPDGRTSVVFAAGDQQPGGSARAPRTVTAQRALPEPVPAATSIDVDELYDQIAARLRRELLLDRERAGELP